MFNNRDVILSAWYSTGCRPVQFIVWAESCRSDRLNFGAFTLPCQRWNVGLSGLMIFVYIQVMVAFDIKLISTIFNVHRSDNFPAWVLGIALLY